MTAQNQKETIARWYQGEGRGLEGLQTRSSLTGSLMMSRLNRLSGIKSYAAVDALLQSQFLSVPRNPNTRGRFKIQLHLGEWVHHDAHRNATQRHNCQRSPGFWRFLSEFEWFLAHGSWLMATKVAAQEMKQRKRGEIGFVSFFPLRYFDVQ